jgi:hypothetical protein
VTDDAKTLVTLDQEPGQVPGDGAEHDPRDDAHLFLHPKYVHVAARSTSPDLTGVGTASISGRL